ncbi:MAG TPA: AmmeMemoRadiSam system radical SAM enzyme, partial [Desulfobacterales bacterium]|nr:AmmeMemoRadiSam system radical SAM enzyme [Desulfobacterales bacterium]
LPGSLSYSIATVGCNFKCRFCQNADIAQLPEDRKGMIVGDRYSPEDVVSSAERANCQSIAYTYTEPTVFFEFAYDTAKLAHEKGILNVFVTNGYMTSEALHMIRPYLDAANVDLKAFNDDFYRQQCSAKRKHVMETLQLMKSLGIFVEVTTLLIPGLNDDKGELRQLAAFIADSLGPETPWHISRFHPTYKLTDRPPTPPESIHQARRIGLDAGLRYVYSGNLPGDDGENTTCHSCDRPLIERWGYHISKNVITDGKCPHCGASLDGIGF